MLTRAQFRMRLSHSIPTRGMWPISHPRPSRTIPRIYGCIWCLVSKTVIKGLTRVDILAEGLGFVEIKRPEQYPTLAEPYIKYNKTVYTTSVTHQLHCLYMIMQGFNEMAVKGSFEMDMDADEGLTREGEDPMEHLAHCVSSIRISMSIVLSSSDHRAV